MAHGKVLVLFYHRINEIPVDLHQLCVSPKNFEQHMKYLKKYYPVLRFEEDWQNAERDSVVITFDDGYFDNYQSAVPVLNELGIPATIFVTTSCLGGDKEFWWDELETILLSDHSVPESFCLEDETYGCQWYTRNYEERKNCYWAIRSMMLYLTNHKKREEWMEQLWHWSGRTWFVSGRNFTITEEMCKEISKMEHMTIGCHTVSHPGLSRLNYKDQIWEINESKKYLEKILSRKIETMSYPHGMYNETTMRICEEVRLKKAATTRPALWNSLESPYMIPRFCIKNWNLYEFKAEIEKMFYE